MFCASYTNFYLANGRHHARLPGGERPGGRRLCCASRSSGCGAGLDQPAGTHGGGGIHCITPAAARLAAVGLNAVRRRPITGSKSTSRSGRHSGGWAVWPAAGSLCGRGRWRPTGGEGAAALTTGPTTSPDTLSAFTSRDRDPGHLDDVADSSETLEAKLMAGRSG